MSATIFEKCLYPDLCEHDSGWGIYPGIPDHERPLSFQVCIQHPGGQLEFGANLDTPAIRLLIAAFLASL